MPDLNPLQRQRRFLVLMSLLLIAFYSLGASVKETAEYSGVGVTLANPQNVLFGAWVIWGWAVWRYAQHVYELASFLWNDLAEDVAAEDARISLAHLRQVARKAAASGAFDEDGRVGVTPEHVSIVGHATEDGGSQSFVLERDRSRRYVIHVTARWGSTIGTFTHVLTVSALTVRWIRIRAWIYAVIALPAFSEHAAPLLLAVAVPLLAIYFSYAG